MPDEVTNTEASDVRDDVVLDEGGPAQADAGTQPPEPEPDPGESTAEWVAVDRCECPLCGDEFDDATRFRDHLGDEHGLYDEEGTTSVLMLPSVTTIAAPEPAVSIVPIGPPRARAHSAPPEKFPVGLAIFVLLLIFLGGGVVYLVQSDDHSDLATDNAPTLSGAGIASPATTAPSPLGPAGADGTAAPDAGGVTATIDQAGPTEPAAPVAAGIGPTPTTSSASTTTAPATTAPQPTFVAPTTSGATVDSCARDHGQFVVTYSWQFVGGAGWSPLATYTPLGGGRYQDTVKVARNSSSSITTVQVTDPNGTRHGVALSPALSTSVC